MPEIGTSSLMSGDWKAHGEAGFGGGRRDRLDDHAIADEWFGAPVLADEREEAVLDLVPLAGAGRQVADHDVEAEFVGFSRGAYAARALSGFLNRLGLIRKEGLWLLPFFFKRYQELLHTGRDFDARTERLWLNYVHPEFRSIPVHFLGVWDTVAALGIPVKGLSRLTVNYESFHDASLTPNVTHATTR
jgi:hypothetical protein